MAIHWQPIVLTRSTNSSISTVIIPKHMISFFSDDNIGKIQHRVLFVAKAYSTVRPTNIAKVSSRQTGKKLMAV